MTTINSKPTEVIAYSIRHAIEDARACFDTVEFTYKGVTISVCPCDAELDVYSRWNEARRERDKAAWFAKQREAVGT